MKTTSEINQRFIVLLVLGGIGIFSVAAGHFLKLNLCAVYSIVGVPCPSCGMTRAVTSVFRGDLYAALRFHPLFWFWCFIPLLASRRIPARAIHAASACFAALFLIVWLVRLLLYFPETEPMNFNKEALIPRIFNSMSSAPIDGGE